MMKPVANTPDLRNLVRLADGLREAQKAYMLVRDTGTRQEREALGQAVAEAAANYDAARAMVAVG